MAQKPILFVLQDTRRSDPKVSRQHTGERSHRTFHPQVDTTGLSRTSKSRMRLQALVSRTSTPTSAMLLYCRSQSSKDGRLSPSSCGKERETSYTHKHQNREGEGVAWGTHICQLALVQDEDDGALEVGHETAKPCANHSRTVFIGARQLDGCEAVHHSGGTVVQIHQLRESKQRITTHTSTYLSLSLH